MGRSVAALMLFGALLACDRTPETDTESVRQVIDAHNANIERWFVAGHVDSLAAVFAEGAWQMPPNSPALVGRDALRAYWTNAMRWGSWRFDFQTQEVLESGDLAVERGRYTLNFTPREQAPMPAFEDRGNYVALWRHEPDGEWRIVWDAPVSELPASGAAP